VTQPRVLLAITLLLVSAGLSARRWITQPSDATGTASGVAICTASSDPGARCELPKSGHPLRVAGISSAAVSVAFSAGVAFVLLLGLLGSAALQQRVARNAFRVLAIAVAVDVVLIVLQLFVWHDVCALCLASYGMTIVAAVLLHRPSEAAPAALEPVERRLFIGGSVFASVLLLLTVGAGELWLRQHARASLLQATLDSPAKRDAYDADQAVVKFQAAPVVTFDLSGAPRLGATDGPIVVVEYVDYLCPFCRQLYGGLDEYLAHNGRVSWYFKNYPLDTACNPTLPENYHPGACWLARGAVCAKDAGKWVEYYRAAFAKELEHPGPADVTRLGAQVGLDRSSYGRCIQSPATVAAVAADVADGVRAHAQGTPTLFINGRRAPLWTYIEPLVAAEERRLGLAAPDSTR
jgi:protein-disulfide isomerase/uncharacterized membrane protein